MAPAPSPAAEQSAEDDPAEHRAPEPTPRASCSLYTARPERVPVAAHIFLGQLLRVLCQRVRLLRLSQRTLRIPVGLPFPLRPGHRPRLLQPSLCLRQPGTRLGTHRPPMCGDVVRGRPDARARGEHRPVQQRPGPPHALLVLARPRQRLVERRVRLLHPPQRVDRVVRSRLHLPAHLRRHRLRARDPPLQSGRRHALLRTLQQSTRLGQVRVRLGERARQLPRRLRELLCPPVDGVDELPGLRDRALRSTYLHRRRAVVGLLDRLPGRLKTVRREFQPFPGLLHIARHGCGRGRCVPLAHHAECRLRADDAAVGLPEGLVRGGERLRGVALQLAQPVEVLGLRVETAIGSRAAGDDLVQHPAAGGVVLRIGVVELLTQPERGGQLVLRLRHGLGERLRRLLPELGGGEAQFLLAGAHRVIRVHQRLLGPGVEFGQRRLLLRRSPSLLTALRSGAGRGPPFAPGVRVRGQRPGAADHRDGQHKITCSRAGAGVRARIRCARCDGDLRHRPAGQHRVVPVGSPDRGAGPVVLPQRGLHGLAGDLRELGVGQPGAGVDVVGVLPVVRGDGEEDVVRAESVLPRRLVRPLLCGTAGEVAYVHHEELQPLMVVEAVQSLLDLWFAVVQRTDAVGDLSLAGKADGVVGVCAADGGHDQPPRRHQYGKDSPGGSSCHIWEAMPGAAESRPQPRTGC